MLDKKFKTALKVMKIILIVVIVFILGSILLQKISNNKVSLFGFGMYTVVSDSMIPDYEIGDMFLSKSVDKEDIKVGDDVVYLGKVGDYNGKVITHRVIRIEDKIYTRGINNNADDPPIEYSQVYGKVIKRLPILSVFSKLMNNSILFYMVVFVPFSLLFFFDLKQVMKDKEKLEKEKNKEEDKEENKE